MNDEHCEDCKTLITFGEYKYSMNQFYRALCQECQQKERGKIYPEKLAKFLNTELGKGASRHNT